MISIHKIFFEKYYKKLKEEILPNTPSIDGKHPRRWFPTYKRCCYLLLERERRKNMHHKLGNQLIFWQQLPSKLYQLLGTRMRLSSKGSKIYRLPSRNSQRWNHCKKIVKTEHMTLKRNSCKQWNSWLHQKVWLLNQMKVVSTSIKDLLLISYTARYHIEHSSSNECYATCDVLTDQMSS